MMANSSIPVHNPHARRWMMYVDGENLAIRAKEFAKAHGLTLTPGPWYQENVYVWFPGAHGTLALTNSAAAPVEVQPQAIRSHYYTSVTGDEALVTKTRHALWERGFQAEIFKKASGARAKGVDVSLTKDMLRDAFLNNYDVAVLVAGDGDYAPLVADVKRQGKVVYGVFFDEMGLSPTLKLATDRFFAIDDFFKERWAPTVPKEAPPPDEASSSLLSA